MNESGILKNQVMGNTCDRKVRKSTTKENVPYRGYTCRYFYLES